MFEIEARLLARGAVGALAAGFVQASAVILDLALTRLNPLWPGSAGEGVLLTVGCALLVAPFSIFVLPITWISFRRSKYRYVALIGTGVIGGAAWSLEFSIILRETFSLYPLLAVGALSGLSAASCFLKLTASTP